MFSSFSETHNFSDPRKIWYSEKNGIKQSQGHEFLYHSKNVNVHIILHCQVQNTLFPFQKISLFFSKWAGFLSSSCQKCNRPSWKARECMAPVTLSLLPSALLCWREAGSISFYRSWAPYCLCHQWLERLSSLLVLSWLNHLDFDSKVIKMMIIVEMAMIIYKDTHIIISWLKSEKKKQT